VSEPRANELLAIALEVLEDEGLENLGVGTISRRAGIKPPSLYKQFESKADIEQQLAHLGFRLWAETLAAASTELPSSATRRDHISALTYAYRELGREHPQLFRLMNERPVHAARLLPAVGETTTIDYGALFPSLTAGMSFWAWGHGILALEIAGRLPPEIDLDVMWETMIDAVSTVS